MKRGEKIIVCATCFRASCWNGIFYCDDYQNAGIVWRTKAQLLRMKKEHPSYLEEVYPHWRD